MVSPDARARAASTSVVDVANDALERIEILLPTRALRERYRTWRQDLSWITRDLVGGQRPVLVSRDEVDERTARRELEIGRIEPLEPGGLIVHLTERDGSPVEFEAGQQLTLVIERDGRSTRGRFPLLGSPLDGVSAVVVGDDPPSALSTALREGRLTVGATLLGAGPYGIFGAPEEGDVERLVMIAFGLGIVPTLSVAETVLRTQPDAAITLLVGGARELLCADHLDTLAAAHPERLDVQRVLSEPPEDFGGLRGDLAQDAVVALLADLKLRVEAKRYYLHGPASVMSEVREVLAAHGVGGAAVVQERFPRPSDDRGESDHGSAGIVSGDGLAQAVSALLPARDPRILTTVGPSAIRGRILRRGKQGVPTTMPASHASYFDWSYPSDYEGLTELFREAQASQWQVDELPWHIEVDPYDPQVPLISDDFLDFALIERITGVEIAPERRLQHRADVFTWMMSQYLHGEQAALVASAQITESVRFFEGKLFGATQVADEGRHVEVFHRYVSQKLEKLYQIDDNLFVLIDALITEGRWDVKFLGTQIMVKGIALGAFSTLCEETSEPLLTALLQKVIADERRHLSYGVRALRDHIIPELSESERREREDWAFELAVLMRDRFLGYEIFQESFDGMMTRPQWRRLIRESAGMERFRSSLFGLWGPSLRSVGLLTSRIEPHYAQAGLKGYFTA